MMSDNKKIIIFTDEQKRSAFVTLEEARKRRRRSLRKLGIKENGVKVKNHQPI